MSMNALKLLPLVALLAACSGGYAGGTDDGDTEPTPVTVARAAAQTPEPTAQPVAQAATETPPGNQPDAVQPKPVPAPADATAPKADPTPPVTVAADAGPPPVTEPVATAPNSVPIGGDCEADVDCSGEATCLAGSKVCHLGKLQLGEACTAGDPCRCRQLYDSWPPVFACCSALDSACIQE
jgi:hypothetical protein